MTYPNWFAISKADVLFERYLTHLRDTPCSLLQIGAFVGDASVWLADNVLTHELSSLTDVDTWEGSDEDAHRQMSWSNIYDTYKAKVSMRERISHSRQTSDNFFAANTETYDFVYVDGDHTEPQVARDADNSWCVLRKGGIIAFDDYVWGPRRSPELRPQRAIDDFINRHADDLEVLHVSNQAWIRKI